MLPPSKYFHVRSVDKEKRNFVAFKIMENAGNGDCLFTSIMQYLDYVGIYEVPNNETDLRHRIVDYVTHSSNWSRFVDTIIFNLENLLPILLMDDFSEMFKRKVYGQYMRQQWQYGTFAELQAAAELFNFVYVVFRKEHRRADVNGTYYSCYSSEEDNNRKSKMFLFFSGMPSSGHFQFMKPILPNHSFVVPPGEYRATEKNNPSNNSFNILTVEKVTNVT